MTDVWPIALVTRADGVEGARESAEQGNVEIDVVEMSEAFPSVSYAATPRV